ncbi:MAG: putative membrane protein YgcG [Enterobacterales bacterium]|jgi:uncharacterized membrane protein YgcG
MSGIINFTKQTITIVSIAAFILSFSAISGAEEAAEKTVKASIGKKNNVVHKLVSVSSNSKITQKTSMATQSTGLSTELSSQLSTVRSSSYKDVSDPGLMIKQNSSGQEFINNNTRAKQNIRSETLPNSSNSGHIYFYSVAVDMNYDSDGDGYYSDFTLSFDADTSYSYVTVYASLYVSLNGGSWEHYFTTDNFELNGVSSSDVYDVRTQLTTGFPPGSYDILIDLYDAYDDTLAATISADDEFELAEHYLEDITYEDSIGSSSDFSIFSASLSLLDDNDNDGYYQSFSLQFDADVSSGEAYVYAEIWVRDSSGNWERDFITEDFLLEGNSTLDTYILETVWESGYSTGYYDFRIEIYDADSFALVATSEAQDYELGTVPLEDASQDTLANNGGTGGTSNGGNSTSISQGSGGGGSFGFALVILILAYSIRRTAIMRVKA